MPTDIATHPVRELTITIGRHPMRTTLAGAALAALALTGCGTAAHAGNIGTAASVPPYGGCKEGWQAPHSQGADWCRDRGWVIRHRLIVSPTGVVRYVTLPHCREEDGSGQRSACTWNILRGTDTPDGNGTGLSYWVGRNDRVHYVWPDRMLGTPVKDTPLEDALVEGDRQNWDYCWLDEARTHVACPDGLRVRVYGQRH